LAMVNLPLPDARLRLFIEGREDWLEEGLLVPARKNKRGRIVEGTSSAQASGAQPNVPPLGGIPPPPSYCGGPQEQAWGVVHRYPHQIMWCPTQTSRSPTHNIPTTTKHGYNWRVCCEKRPKCRSHPIQRGSTWWGQCKYCLWAWTPSPSGAESIHWRECPTLLRARVLLSRSSTPTTGGGLGRLRNFSFLFFSFSL
jgi:hypothetical protein